MHLRRALLLFAIVLGLAALATSLSRPEDDSSDEPAPPPSSRTTTNEAVPGNADPPTTEETFRFSSKGKPKRHTVTAGTAATVEVTVEEDGQVELEGLGLNQPAEPGTPAVFYILPNDEGTVEVLFTPVVTDEFTRIGKLKVRAGPL